MKRAPNNRNTQYRINDASYRRLLVFMSVYVFVCVRGRESDSSSQSGYDGNDEREGKKV